MHRVAYIKMVIWVYAPPFIIWNNKVKNVKNIAILFKLLLYICWFQKGPFFNLFLVFKFFICSPDIAAQFHLKLRWICRPPLALATWTRPDNQGSYLCECLLLANLNLFTKNVNLDDLLFNPTRVKTNKKLPLLIRPSKQYTKGAKTSVLKQCAILKFVILYINYLLPVSSNMSTCNCKTNRNDNTEN